ncbi:recombinase family protein [Streptomyces phaeochromogenes]|uniref:recombinase family protein n=1 Tax=Streptomyces phaeochromogenes TaxID=1923 RepID=UPI00371ADF0F
MATATVQIATEVATRTAREYLRVSKGKGRTARSITDQHTQNLAAETEHGPWTWGESYKDTGSASKYATRARGDFDKLMADLTSRAFGEPGDVLVLWEISRLARETGKGVAIIDLCEAGGYLIHLTSQGGDLGRTYDPRNWSDRAELISGINDAEKEARKLSARTLRGVNSAAREGRPHGRIPFGYARDYEVIDGRPRCVRQYPDPVSGPLIKELFKRAAGSDDTLPEPVYAIAQDWEARGIRTPDRMVDGELVPGKPFHDGNLREMLTKSVYAGLREHNGTLVPVQWEGWTPLVSRELFDQVQRRFADPSRRTYLGTGVQHILTSTLRCDACGGPITVRCRKAGVPGYECLKKGCARVDKAETDRILIGDLEPTDPETGEPLPPELGVILAYLSAPYRVARLRQRPENTPEQQAAQAELFRLRRELKELEDAPRPKTAKARIALVSGMEEMETDIAALEAKLSRLTAPDPLTEILPSGSGTDLIEWWTSADVQRQRAVAALLLTPELLGQVRITPSQGWRDPVTERIKWVTA